MKTLIKKRESGLELYRIIFMLLIIAHHYVVNSGVQQELARGSEMGFNDAFLWLLGGWLWRDVCNNVGWMNSPHCWFHAVGCVFAVYAICMVIDLFYLRLIEKRLLDCIEGICKKFWKCVSQSDLV